MKIVLHHPTVLPARGYGGVERVVLWLARGLRAGGHDVWVVASPESQLPNGIALIPVSVLQSKPEDLRSLLPPGIDLVHFMAPVTERVAASFPCPVLQTVHGNGKPREIFLRNSVFLSRNHAQRHGADAFVWNGVDPDELLFSSSVPSTANFLFLSKTSWRVKNLSGAMRIARRAKVPLSIAGGRGPGMLRFRAALTRGMHWVGPVGGRSKAEFLASGRALLFPVRWAEPFGLVVVESLMSGTPVIASRMGSLPELISADVGMLLDPDREQDWIDSVRGFSASSISRIRCRDWAVEKFHYQVMSKSYEGLYQQVLRGEFLHDRAPVGPLAFTESQGYRGET